MKQLSIFAGTTAERIKNPICIYMTHCGAMSVLGPRMEWDGGYNETIYCEKCQRVVGERRTRINAKGKKETTT